MASTFLYAFSLCLILCAVSSKPVAQDLNSVKYLDNVTPKHDTEMAVDTAEVINTGLVRSVDRVLSLQPGAPSFADNFKSLKRAKRQVMRGPGCPRNRIWYKRRCVTFRRYERLVQDVEE